MNTRYTNDGGDALEHFLEQTCLRAADALARILPARRLRAIVLGGGYGRGEGGVLITSEGECPYNDLEFYLLIGGSDWLASRRYSRVLHALENELSQFAGVDVEFKLLSLRKLRRAPVTMFYYDLVSGHKLLHGSDDWLVGCDHHRASHRIPLYEVTRLLMNRCSGLLFAKERLARAAFTEEDADFVGRNLAKAKLAFGDVLLAMRGQYHWSCRERHKRFRKLSAEKPEGNIPSLLLLHEQGVEFKLHPVRTTRSASELRPELQFLQELGRELWLQLESRRLARAFSSIESYCADLNDKCPETHRLKNLCINARSFGPAGFMDMRYPRERLLRALPRLLWLENEPSDDSEAAVFAREVRRYEALWKRFN